MGSCMIYSILGFGWVSVIMMVRPESMLVRCKKRGLRRLVFGGCYLRYMLMLILKLVVLVLCYMRVAPSWDMRRYGKRLVMVIRAITAASELK